MTEPRRVFGYEDNGKGNPTKQEFRDECDVNLIVKRFQQTGIAPPSIGAEHYLDVSEVTDYKQAVDMLMAAEDDFRKLPMYIKEAVGNSAQGLLDFVADEDNQAQLVEWGFLEPPATPAAEQKKPEDKGTTTPEVANVPDGT